MAVSEVGGDAIVLVSGRNRRGVARLVTALRAGVLTRTAIRWEGARAVRCGGFHREPPARGCSVARRWVRRLGESFSQPGNADGATAPSPGNVCRIARRSGFSGLPVRRRPAAEGARPGGRLSAHRASRPGRRSGRSDRDGISGSAWLPPVLFLRRAGRLRRSASGPPTYDRPAGRVWPASGRVA